MTQELSITTFRYVPGRAAARLWQPTRRSAISTTLNAALLDALQRGGELFVSNAIVHGRYALRACIVNFHTERADVESVPETVVRYGRRLDSELRPAALR